MVMVVNGTQDHGTQTLPASFSSHDRNTVDLSVKSISWKYDHTPIENLGPEISGNKHARSRGLQCICLEPDLLVLGLTFTISVAQGSKQSSRQRPTTRLQPPNRERNLQSSSCWVCFRSCRITTIVYNERSGSVKDSQL